MNWESLGHAVTASILTRLLANIFVFAILVAATIVGAIELVNHEVPNSYVVLILGAGLGYAMSLLGINQGVTLQPLTNTPPAPKDTTI